MECTFKPEIPPDALIKESKVQTSPGEDAPEPPTLSHALHMNRELCPLPHQIIDYLWYQQYRKNDVELADSYLCQCILGTKH